MYSYSLWIVELTSSITGRGSNYCRSRHQSQPREHSSLITVLSKQITLLQSTACLVQYEMYIGIYTKPRVELRKKKRNPLAFYSVFNVSLRVLLITLLNWPPMKIVMAHVAIFYRFFRSVETLLLPQHEAVSSQTFSVQCSQRFSADHFIKQISLQFVYQRKN